jgi:hypothetical protein
VAGEQGKGGRGHGRAARRRITRPYLPEPPDIARHPAWDSPICARSAPALPSRMINPTQRGVEFELGAGGLGCGYRSAVEASRSSS